VGGKEFVLAILFFILLFKLIDSYVKSRSNRRDTEVEQSAHSALAQIAELEERVRVLERIVTDDGFDVRRQFRDLGR
jgi:hypothetical protein